MRQRPHRIHTAWYIAWAAGGVVTGIGLALVVPPVVFGEPVWLAAAVLLFYIAMQKRTRQWVLLACVAGSLLGLWRGCGVQYALQAYRPYYAQQVQLQGAIAEDPTLGPRGEQRMQLRAVQVEDRFLPGNVWVSLADPAEFKRGDVVVVWGELSEGFGSIPASMFQARVVRVVHPQPGDVARQFRDWFASGVRLAIPEPEASLGVGYLVGQHSTLPEGLEEQLRIVGLTHVVVASGYNLTILVGLARRLFARWSKYLATLVGAALIVGFMLVTGLSPSMSRAGLVAGLSLAAWYYGRTMHPLVLLPFAAACTALVQPAYVWGDVGWHLSFGAFAGVLVLAPLLHRYFWGRSSPSVLRQVLVDTFAAQLATAPIILTVFGQYGLYALPVNALVLPFVPLAMLATFVAGVAGLALPVVAAMAGWPAMVILRYSIGVVERFAQLPGARGEWLFSPVLMIVSYATLALVMLWMWHVTRTRLKTQDIFDKNIDS